MNMKVYELIFLFKNQLDNTLSKDNTIKKSLDNNEINKNTYIKIAYNNVINKIKSMYENNENITKNSINNLDITNHMKDKLNTLLNQKINIIDSNKLKKSYLLDELINIAGIGKKKAEELINLGLTNIKQLKLKKWEQYLTSGTILLLKNKPLRKIPYSMIKHIEPKFTNFKCFDIKIVGGFIRKKPFSKDIDILLISDKKTILSDYIKYLKTVFNDVHIYIKGKNKASIIICNNYTKENYFLKVDIFISPIKYQYAMLLYSTGSKKFNIKLRSLARRKGYLLNQYGIFKYRDDQKIINIYDKPIHVNSEHDFFKILNIPYVLPIDR